MPTNVKPSSSNRRLRFGLEAFLFVLLLSVAAYLWTAPRRTEQRLRHASLGELEEEAQREPDDPRVCYYLGLRQEEAGQTDGAAKTFEHVVALDGDDETAWLAWARTAGATGGPGTEAGVLRLCLQKHSGGARIHAALARAYQKLGMGKSASEEADIATGLDPNSAEAWGVLGEQRLAASNLTGAEPALRRAIALDPTMWRDYLALGALLIQLKRAGEAVSVMSEAARLAPREAAAHMGLADALLEEATTPEDMTRAQQNLLQAAALQPDIPCLHLLLGESWARQERWPQARKELEQAARLDPRGEKVHYWLERVYRRLGEEAAANREGAIHDRLLAQDLENAALTSRIAQGDTDPQTRLRLARLYSAEGDWSAAADQYRALLARDPHMAVAQRELAALTAKLPPQQP